MVFPCLVSIIGTWFSKSKRGLITGAWGTSTNMGNIAGLHLSAAILNITDRKWGQLMNVMSVIFFVNTLIAYMFLRPTPEQENIIIELEDEIDKLVLEEAQAFKDTVEIHSNNVSQSRSTRHQASVIQNISSGASRVDYFRFEELKVDDTT